MATHSFSRRFNNRPRLRQRRCQIRCRDQRHGHGLVLLCTTYHRDHRSTRHDIEYKRLEPNDGMILSSWLWRRPMARKNEAKCINFWPATMKIREYAHSCISTGVLGGKHNEGGLLSLYFGTFLLASWESRLSRPTTTAQRQQSTTSTTGSTNADRRRRAANKRQPLVFEGETKNGFNAFFLIFMPY